LSVQTRTFVVSTSIECHVAAPVSRSLAARPATCEWTAAPRSIDLSRFAWAMATRAISVARSATM